MNFFWWNVTLSKSCKTNCIINMLILKKLNKSIINYPLKSTIICLNWLQLKLFKSHIIILKWFTFLAVLVSLKKVFIVLVPLDEWRLERFIVLPFWIQNLDSLLEFGLLLFKLLLASFFHQDLGPIQLIFCCKWWRNLFSKTINDSLKYRVSPLNLAKNNVFCVF